MTDRIPRLANDHALIRAMQNEMKFVEDPQLRFLQKKLEMIRYFERVYGDTDQDTVVYGPEFVIVVRNILEGNRPVRLRYLTEFEGEEPPMPPPVHRSPMLCEHANEVPHMCPCDNDCYCKSNTCMER